MIYLGLNETKRGGPKRSQAIGRKQKTPSGMISLGQSFLWYFKEENLLLAHFHSGDIFMTVILGSEIYCLLIFIVVQVF